MPANTQNTARTQGQSPDLDMNIALPGRFLKQADPTTPVDELGEEFSKWLRQHDTGGEEG